MCHWPIMLRIKVTLSTFLWLLLTALVLLYSPSLWSGEDLRIRLTEKERAWLADHPIKGGEKYADQQIELLKVRVGLREREATRLGDGL